MKTIKILTVIFGLLTLCAVNAFAQDGSPGTRKEGHHGPPPEAFKACEGKTAGDAAQFVNPHGDTVTGTCAEMGDRLALRPDHHGKGPDHHGRAMEGKKGFGPPPEAFKACEGKTAGDAAQFVNPHGDTVTGTCEKMGDRLALRPDR